MTPEEKARIEIDRQLDQCGWVVQDHSNMNISADVGVAVREFPLKSGFADYLLYADRKAIGVIEAKREGHTLTGVETQSAKYAEGLPDILPHYHLPLPFAYESTGVVTQFTNGLDPYPRSREVFTFHRPDELIRLATLGRQLGAPAWRALVATAGLAKRATALECRTALKTVDVFVIAAPADAYLSHAPGAVVKPIARLDRHRIAPAEALDSAAPSRHPLHSARV